MTNLEIIQILTNLNQWRRGGEMDMPAPKLIGVTIDAAIAALSATPAIPDELREIGRLLATQSNRCTDQPLWLVQQKRIVTGIDTDYVDDIVWLVEDYMIFPGDEEYAALEAAYDETGEEPDNHTRTGYAEEWKFVTACFTEQGCKDYIRQNGHNLKEPRIYADGSYRNHEYQAVRNWLRSLYEVKQCPN